MRPTGQFPDMDSRLHRHLDQERVLPVADAVLRGLTFDRRADVEPEASEQGGEGNVVHWGRLRGREPARVNQLTR